MTAAITGEMFAGKVSVPEVEHVENDLVTALCSSFKTSDPNGREFAPYLLHKITIKFHIHDLLLYFAASRIIFAIFIKNH